MSIEMSVWLYVLAHEHARSLESTCGVLNEIFDNAMNRNGELSD